MIITEANCGCGDGSCLDIKPKDLFCKEESTSILNMAEILKEWLTERLQRPITWEAEAFGDMMKNGYVIAGVLLSYGVIVGEEHYLIRSGNNIEEVKDNWKYIRQWLLSLDIHLSNVELENLMNGESSCLLRLFYRLFLHLDKKDRTDFIKRERKMVSGLVEKLGHRFQVDKIPEEEESFVDNLSKPLLNEKHFIEWQRKKSAKVKDTYDYIRHKYSKMVDKIKELNTPMNLKDPTPPKLTYKERRDMQEFTLKYPCQFQNYTYEQLLALEEKVLEHKSSISSTEWTKNYMENLHTRIHKKTDSEEFQKQLSNVLSGSIWDMSVAEEETKQDIELAKKVMKLSQFEKQMCTQIMETKQQARNLFNNRLQAQKEFSEQRDEQFNQFLDNIKEHIHSEVEEIDFEKRRQEILHKRLYAEKMKRKRQHYYEICYETMLSIVDYATRYGYFKKLIGDDIPNHFIHEWKTLYYKQQPIFDILEPMEEILIDHSEEERPPQIEEIVRLELDRQEALNDSEFKEYHNYSHPWTLELLIPNYDPESEERKYEYLGTRILGHVVYTLLEIKYPYPPPRPPADLPNYTSKAILRGLPDRSITVPMQHLLNLRKIHVVRLESAINFALRQFKYELIGCTDIELSFDKFLAAAEEEEDKELIKLMKIDDESTYKQSDLAVASMLGVTPANTKQTQTPKTIPEEEIALSAAADLGKYAYESLNAGDTLTDYLLAAMIVEYLKDQDDISGFVIINYPNTYREAQILEETFLGIAPPDDTELDDRDEIYLEESIAKHRKKEKDPFKDVRISRLVNDPHKKRIVKPFESYFTCYIDLKNTEDILQELVIWDLNEDNSELIDRFYAVLGLNYSLYYEIIDKDLLAQICKYIIGDLVLPLKSCETLFGEGVLSVVDFPVSEDKRTKSKIVRPEVSTMSKSREKLSRNKMSKSSLSNELEVVKEPSAEKYPDDISEEIGEIEKSVLSVEEVKILPGEEDWDYGEIPISELIGIALANCWEEVEHIYIRDLEQLFFAKRLQMNCLIPYARYIKDKMEQIITLPSNKQDIVSRFQMEYNEFENDWRDVGLAKNEWHCRVKELQNKLYHICDERKLYAEQQRMLLIRDNWTMEELTSMANTYISCMQTELNRSIMTYQAFHDFYFSMLKRLPPNDRLVSKDLTKIYKDSDEVSGSKKGGEDKVYRQLKAAFQELHLKNIAIDYSNNPFNLVIENNVKFALKVIKDTNESYRSLVAKEYNEVAKIQPTIKKKDDGSSEDSVNEEEVFKQNALKCVEEWTVGINGEMFRASLRILALQYKCYRDMKLFNDHIFRTFMEIQNDIDVYYMNEIKSVDRLCKYLQMAVENGRRIPDSLILEHDTFVIDPNLLQFAPPEPLLDSGEISEMMGEMDFKISQLASLRSQFKIVAPNGIILQQAFIYLLQDFIFFGKESCEGSLFPEIWKRVDPEQISKLVYSFYGDMVYVDWRDFLIYCLNLRFPNLDQLLELRKNFRCKDLASTELISRDEFIEEVLWFETDFDPTDSRELLRKNLIKHFLFELFETSQNMMNYSAFLLAFCKNNDPIEGFVMALAMAVGKRTCHSLDDCEEIVCKLIKDKQYRDACLACARKCASQFLEILLTRTINYCEGITISEIAYVPSVEDKKGGKKGKNVTKSQSAKKIETSQSARLAKISKSVESKNKLTQSATNVKTTFICPPCQELEEKETNLEEKMEKVLEEEAQTEPVPDPNLAYAVSQDVIWNVLRICLPWHFVLLPENRKTVYVDQVNELLKSLEVDTDSGDIYVCKFVTDPNICTMLNKAKKFTIICLADVLDKVLI